MIQHRSTPTTTAGSSSSAPTATCTRDRRRRQRRRPDENAQNLDSLLGKLLRIDPRSRGGQPYSVPGSNPFVGARRRADEIYAYGLRNPYRFSFDRRPGTW